MIHFLHSNAFESRMRNLIRKGYMYHVSPWWEWHWTQFKLIVIFFCFIANGTKKVTTTSTLEPNYLRKSIKNSIVFAKHMYTTSQKVRIWMLQWCESSARSKQIPKYCYCSSKVAFMVFFYAQLCAFNSINWYFGTG